MKQFFSRAFLGFAVGNFIGIFVNIVISASIGQGQYLAVMPQLQSYFTTELAAVICQTVMIGLVGACFAVTSIVYEVERWSFLKQCTVQFLITACIYTPFLYFCYLPHNWIGAASMAGNYLFTYALTWFIAYQKTCRDVSAINRRIEEVKQHDGN